MSLPLKDIRTKVTEETWAMVKGWAAAHNMTEDQVARMVLTEWADRIRHAATVQQRLLDLQGK